AAAFRREIRPPRGPINRARRPLAFLVVGGPARRLVAFDLAAGRARWSVPAAIDSKLVVGRDVVAAREGDAIVARDVDSGRLRWRRPLDGAGFVGLAADADRVYLTSRALTGPPTWTMRGLDSDDGDERWSAAAPGALGVPAARG